MTKQYLVYMENSFTLLGKEFFNKLAGTNKILGFHNPHLAAHFKTQKEAKGFASTINMETKIGDVETFVKKFESTNWLYREFEAINEGHNYKYDPAKHTPKDVLEWRYKTQCVLPEQAVKFEVYHTWPDLFSVFKHLWNISKYSNAKYTEMYNTFQIKTSKNGIFKEFKKEFKMIIDRVTYVNERGYKLLPIFDNGLSEYATYYLMYKDENDCEISTGRHPETKGTLEKCFEYMKNHRWYGDPHEDTDDEN